MSGSTRASATITPFAGAAIYLNRPLGTHLAAASGNRPRRRERRSTTSAARASTLSYRLLNRAGTLASHSIAASRGATPGNQFPNGRRPG